DARVEVHRASFPAELDERHARNFDRHVQHEIAAPNQRGQNTAEVLARQRLVVELDSVFFGLFPAPISRRDDRDAFGCYADVSQEQRQDTLSDAAEANDENPPWEIDIDLVIAHFINARYGCGLTG